MPREMKWITPGNQDYEFMLKDIRAGKYQQLASVSSIKWGWADLYRFPTKAPEFVIVTMRARQETRYPYANIYIGGKQETGKTWRALCRTIGAGMP